MSAVSISAASQSVLGSFAVSNRKRKSASSRLSSGCQRDSGAAGDRASGPARDCGIVPGAAGGNGGGAASGTGGGGAANRDGCATASEAATATASTIDEWITRLIIRTETCAAKAIRPAVNV